MHKINQIPGEVSFFRALMDYAHGYADFKGRSTRAGYWWVKLVIGIFHFLFFLILFQADVSAMRDAALLLRYGYLNQEGVNKETLEALLHVLPVLVFYSLFWLGIFIPTMALLCRRMRDVGLRGRGFATHYLTIVLLLVLQYALSLQKITVGLASFGELMIDLCIFLNSCLTVGLLIFTLLPSDWLATTSKKRILRFFFRKKAPKSAMVIVEKPVKVPLLKQAETVEPCETIKQPKAKPEKIKHKKAGEASETQKKTCSENLLVKMSRRLEMGRYLNTAFYAIVFCLIVIFLGIGFGGAADVSADTCFFLALITYTSALLLFLLQLVVNVVGSFRSFQISTKQIVVVCVCLGMVSLYTRNAAFSLIITLVVLFLDKKTYQMLLKSNITRNFEYTLSFFKLIWITFYGAMYVIGEFHSAIYHFATQYMSRLYTTPFFSELASDIFPALCTFILWPILLLILHVVVALSVQSNKKHTTNRKIDEGITLPETNVK